MKALVLLALMGCSAPATVMTSSPGEDVGEDEPSTEERASAAPLVSDASPKLQDVAASDAGLGLGVRSDAGSDTGPADVVQPPEASADAGSDTAAPPVDAGPVIRCGIQPQRTPIYTMQCSPSFLVTPPPGTKIEWQDHSQPPGPAGYPWVYGCGGNPGTACRVWYSNGLYQAGIVVLADGGT